MQLMYVPYCSDFKLCFLCPCHEMAKGHIAFTLSVCMCFCFFVFQNRVWPITLSCMVGFENIWHK